MIFRQHKEGRLIVGASSLFVVVCSYLLIEFGHPILALVLITVMLILYLWVVAFFRNPVRKIEDENPNIIWAPADGKVVAIEKTVETEYYNKERIQVSIFMSIFNVHVNRIPFDGDIPYVKYHEGKFLVAWHPKSSTENERNTVVVQNGTNSILMRQIAGALARRIICYLKPNQQVNVGQDFGFIKFGSRVDVFLPLDAEVRVEIGQKVKGNKTRLAEFAAM